MQDVGEEPIAEKKKVNGLKVPLAQSNIFDFYDKKDQETAERRNQH